MIYTPPIHQSDWSEFTTMVQLDFAIYMYPWSRRILLLHLHIIHVHVVEYIDKRYI